MTNHDDELAYGLTESSQYDFYKAHHLTRLLSELAERRLDDNHQLDINAESLAISLQVICDLTDPKKIKPLGKGGAV